MEDLPEEAMLTLHSEGQAGGSSLGNVSEQHRQLKKKILLSWSRLQKF